jgi:hypothetical protein
MTEAQELRLLAEQSWPGFERKLRRLAKWKKFKKWLGLSLVLSALIFGIYQQYLTAPKSKKSPIIDQVPTILGYQDDAHHKNQLNKATPLVVMPLAPEKAQKELYYPLESALLLPPLSLSNLTISQQSIQYLKPDLITAFACLNIAAHCWSIQENGYSLAALLDQKTLLVLNLMHGDEKLDKYPDLSQDECFYRPTFCAPDYFIHLAQYDISEWITTPMQARVIRNRITPPQYLSQRARRSNAVSIPGTAHQYMTTNDRENPGTFYYRNFERSKPFGASYPRSSANYFQVFYYADRQTKFNALLQHSNDTLVVVSDQATRLTRISMYGVVIDSKEIVFEAKGLKSLKRKEILIDPIRNDCYVVSPTNFHFVFFKINRETGVAHQVYQTKSVWNGAAFEVIDGVLIFDYKSKNHHIELDH